MNLSKKEKKRIKRSITKTIKTSGCGLYETRKNSRDTD